MVNRILAGIILLGIAAIIPICFESFIFFAVRNLGTGWVLTTILLRLLVIIFVALSFKQFFQLSSRLRKLKGWAVFMIALLPGFGISFISPIYTTDYGLFNDGFELREQQLLTTITATTFVPARGHAVCAFFSTNCPHCKAASRMLGANIDAGQTIPVYAFFPGNEGNMEKFLEENNGKKFTPLCFENDTLFNKVAGSVYPSVFLITEGGKTKYHWTGGELNYSALDYLRSLEN
jgi:hypothetical protein